MSHSKAFVAAVWAVIGGVVGLAVGGYGIDLVRLRRPDMELPTLLAMAVMGTVGWCVGLVVAWHRAGPRPRTSRVDVVVFLVAATSVLWIGAQAANEMRIPSFGPFIDEVDPNDPMLLRDAIVFLIASAVAAFTLGALALTRLSAPPSRTAR